MVTQAMPHSPQGVEKVLRDRAEQEQRRLGKSMVWYLKPYSEMGRSVINKLRYDRSGRLIDITDTNDPVLLVEKLGSDSSNSKKKGSTKGSSGGRMRCWVTSLVWWPLTPFDLVYWMISPIKYRC